MREHLAELASLACRLVNTGRGRSSILGGGGGGGGGGGWGLGHAHPGKLSLSLDWIWCIHPIILII